ncbi:hypothetical protein [Gandjariella thermophila]|uniref:hypothetical protein n=1 Tax=Gandjariella thermophila TaxID=1931992 RepID=UPI0021F2711C|nr:hypothetical protein [Gandjariella thermophila]
MLRPDRDVRLGKQPRLAGPSRGRPLTADLVEQPFQVARRGGADETVAPAGHPRGRALCFASSTGSRSGASSTSVCTRMRDVAPAMLARVTSGSGLW